MKNILTLLLLFCSMILNAQSKISDAELKSMDMHTWIHPEVVRLQYPNAFYFYKSAEDYHNNNPISDLQWTKEFESTAFGNAKYALIKNGVTTKTKLSDFGQTWMSNEQGFLMRNYEHDYYIVLADGPLTYYLLLKNGRGKVYKRNDGNIIYEIEKDFDDYYSLTVNGEIKSWNEKILKEYLAKTGLQKQYDDEPLEHEISSATEGSWSKKIAKHVKYINLINEKLGAK